MLTRQDIIKINQLKHENPDFKYFFEKVDEEHTNTLSKISHDLRNSLTTLVSSFQLMEYSNPEVKDIKYWSESMSDIRYMRNFLESLSTYYKSSNLFLKSFSTSSLIDDLVRSSKISSYTKNKNVSLEVKLNGECPLISADGIKLHLTLDQILQNAYEAVDESTGKIYLTYSNYDGFLQFCITDNGCGIEEERLSNVFNLFETNKHGHMGLGLAICDRIVMAHGGYMEISSTPGEGTSVSVFLPSNLICSSESKSIPK